jgi:hypothetical protein
MQHIIDKQQLLNVCSQYIGTDYFVGQKIPFVKLINACKIYPLPSAGKLINAIKI